MRARTVYAIAIFLVGLVSLICVSNANAARLHPEAWYQDQFCARPGWEKEHILPDRARIDCLTPTHAFEVDFADKWAEGIGQALYYASQTDKVAGLVIIIEDPERDVRYLRRIKETLQHYHLRVDVYLIFWRGERV